MSDGQTNDGHTVSQLATSIGQDAWIGPQSGIGKTIFHCVWNEFVMFQRLTHISFHFLQFEKTADHLLDAAYYGQTDAEDGVSERIILGLPASIRTGIFKLIYNHEPNRYLPKLPNEWIQTIWISIQINFILVKID